jgi:hypothetical protein
VRQHAAGLLREQQQKKALVGVTRRAATRESLFGLALPDEPRPANHICGRANVLTCASLA